MVKAFYGLMGLNGLIGWLLLVVAAQASPTQAGPSWVNAKYVSPPSPLPSAGPASSGRFEDSHWNRTIDVLKIEDGTVFFIGPQDKPIPPPLKTKIHQAEYISSLYSKEGEKPYLLLSGLPCAQCSGRKFLYLVRADGSSYDKLLYPGEVRDRGDNRILHESRAFYGQCLPDRGDVFVSLQSEKIRRMRYLQPATFIAEARGQFLEKETIVRWRTAQRIRSEVVRRSQGSQKACFEIKGYDRKTTNIEEQREQEGGPTAPAPIDKNADS